jgi:hypothetical protein
MKISLPQIQCSRGTRAMSLAELMTSLSIFGLILGALLATNMFGMRQDELTNSKLGANDKSRVCFNLILDEIRSSKNIQIGNGYYTNFVALTNGQLQAGPSLQIIPSTNTSLCIYYWFDTNAGALWRAAYSNSPGSSPVLFGSTNIVTQYLTNVTSQWLSASMMFRAMDYTGTTNLTVDPTNYNYNYVVSILMQFYQYQYPMTTVGSNYLFNYYQLTYSATRRSP